MTYVRLETIALNLRSIITHDVYWAALSLSFCLISNVNEHNSKQPAWGPQVTTMYGIILHTILLSALGTRTLTIFPALIYI